MWLAATPDPTSQLQSGEKISVLVTLGENLLTERSRHGAVMPVKLGHGE